MLTGLGAATADGIYGAIAAFGLTAISSFLVSQQFLFGLAGGVFLLYLGTKTVLSDPVRLSSEKISPVNHSGKDLLLDYVSTVALTLTNPMTILSFIAIFSGLGLVSAGGNMVSALLMVTGVIIGSALWWILLSGGVNMFRSRVTPASLKIINSFSGFIMIAFALIAFMRVL